MLAKEKQLVAIADWLADKISDENPPVGYESPIKLKSDLDAEEKVNGATLPSGGESEGGEGEAGSEEGGEAGGEAAPQTEEAPAEEAPPEEPTEN